MSEAVEDSKSTSEAVEEKEKPFLIRLVTDDTKSDDDVLRALDTGEAADVDVEDASGMTSLMHAAWKGRIGLVNGLIKRNADVNAGNHEHGYTVLHFAALANKVDVCRVLIANGAKVDAVNAVKRTPSQMAAFVGNSACVALINNYVPKDDVFYFTR